MPKGNITFQLNLNGFGYITLLYRFMPNDWFAAVRWLWETTNIAYTKVIRLFGNGWWIIHVCNKEVSFIMCLFIMPLFTIIEITESCIYIYVYIYLCCPAYICSIKWDNIWIKTPVQWLFLFYSTMQDQYIYLDIQNQILERRDKAPIFSINTLGSSVSHDTELCCDCLLISESSRQMSTETRWECRTQQCAVRVEKQRERERNMVGRKANRRGEASGYSVHSAQTPCRPNRGTPASLTG